MYWSCRSTIRTHLPNSSQSCRNCKFGTAVRFQPGQRPAVLCLGRVTTCQDHSGSGFWPVLEPNRTEPQVKTRTAGGLPGPVANNIYDSIQHLLKCYFLLFGCQSHRFSSSHIILLLPIRCLWVLNTLSCHSGLSIPMIPDPLRFLLVEYSVFLVVSLLKGSFWIVSCSVLPKLRPLLPPTHSCFHSLHDIVVWSALSTCCICPPEVVTGSCSEHWPLYLVLTSLLGEMLDVARCGPHGGMLCILCQCRYIGSISAKQNIHFVRHFDENSCDGWVRA